MSLSREAILSTAQRLLTDYGLQDLTMRRLASELNVRAGALYYHVPNKQELLLQVARRIMAPLNRPGEPPREILLSLRTRALEFRDAADLMLIAYAMDTQLPPVPALREAMAENAPAAEVDHQVAALMQFTLGSIAVEQNRSYLGSSQTTDDDALATFTLGLDRLLPGAAPD